MLMSHIALYYHYSDLTEKIDNLLENIIKTEDELR